MSKCILGSFSKSGKKGATTQSQMSGLGKLEQHRAVWDSHNFWKGTVCDLIPDTEASQVPEALCLLLFMTGLSRKIEPFYCWGNGTYGSFASAFETQVDNGWHRGFVPVEDMTEEQVPRGDIVCSHKLLIFKRYILWPRKNRKPGGKIKSHGILNYGTSLYSNYM